jgi:plastocyanin
MYPFKSVFKVAAFIAIVCTAHYAPACAGNESSLHSGIIVIKDVPESISPASISVRAGDTVVWYNQGKRSITIRLLPLLSLVCSPIVNFYADISGVYKTGTINQGGTASLCFIYKGVYDYEVKWINREGTLPLFAKVISGKIIVEE